jgi:thioredoxin-related protein
VNGLEQDWGDRVRVIQLNVHDGDARELIARLDFRFTPTFILFDKGGREVWRKVGSIDADEVQEQVDGL